MLNVDKEVANNQLSYVQSSEQICGVLKNVKMTFFKIKRLSYV